MIRLPRYCDACRHATLRFGKQGKLDAFRNFASSSSISSPNMEPKKRLDVALVGAPNAGKSQLLNVLTQTPVAAVSRKRHTTRSDILGARTIGDTQIVFKDTPGFLRIENAKEERLSRDLIATAASEMQQVDFTLLVIDAARSLSDNYREALVHLMANAINSKGRIEEDFEEASDTTEIKEDGEAERLESKFAIVLNKVDLVKPKSKLIDIAMDLGGMADAVLLETFNQDEEEKKEELDFKTMLELAPIVFYVSALKEDGTDEIIDHLVSLATPCNTWAVESGQSTNMTTLEHVEEIIREKMYRCLHQELPHSIIQSNRMFREVPQGVIIHQDLIVFSKSHQRLVLGSGGRTLQRIQDTAARDIQKVLGREVVLRLHIKMNKSKQRRSADDYFES